MSQVKINKSIDDLKNDVIELAKDLVTDLKSEKPDLAKINRKNAGIKTISELITRSYGWAQEDAGGDFLKGLRKELEQKEKEEKLDA